MTSEKNSMFRIGAAVALATALALCGAAAHANDANRIQPWTENPTYWQYQSKPILLVGGSDQDNLFNHPDLPPNGLEAHLNLMVSVGGNYVRNTMSTRDEGNIFAYERNPSTGLYDLDHFNDAYWERFRNFLELTSTRGIIVQIEVFDRFDFAYDVEVLGGWAQNPFNPKNNSTYTAEESRLPEKIEGHPGRLENPFFRSIPELEDNSRLLAYQEAYVGRMLSISLGYGNVLYCVSNETNDSEEWSRHWAKFIRSKAKEEGVGVEVTEMWDNWDLTHAMHRRTFDHPDLYSFVDVSQNNHQVGQKHWDNMQAARKLIANPPRPMNNVKIYGGERHGGSVIEATRKLWQIVLGGCASARFHRPGPTPGFYGVGLGELAQTHLKSMRLFTADFDVFKAEPDNSLLSDRAENEAYCMADPGKQYAVYFPDGGAVKLDVSAAQGAIKLRWLDIGTSKWHDVQTAGGGGAIELSTPGAGPWAALVRKAD